jgi:hypothetical protein
MNPDKLSAYKITLSSLKKGIVLKDQSVVFSGEPPYIINWKGRSYRNVYVGNGSERADKLPVLTYSEVSACDLTSIAVFLDR